MSDFWTGFEKRADEQMGYGGAAAAAATPKPAPPPPDTPDRPASISGGY